MKHNPPKYSFSNLFVPLGLCVHWFGAKAMTHEDESTPPFFVKLCTDKATFEVRTKQGLYLDMNEVKRTLEESKAHKIVVYTPHIIILKTGRAETTLCRDGRMLIKRVTNEVEASQVASKILQAILK